MRSPFNQLLLRWLILALGVALATRLIPGIRCDDAGTLIAVVLLLSLFNAVLKPLMVLFTLPFILLTMGLGIVVINALLFLLAGRLVSGLSRQRLRRGDRRRARDQRHQFHREPDDPGHAAAAARRPPPRRPRRARMTRSIFDRQPIR